MSNLNAVTNHAVGTPILIIEDDATLLRGLSDNFSTAGYAVSTAIDGKAGLAAVLSQRPDLVVLDIMLPSINGFDLCRRIRDEKLTMPVLMLTAKGQEDEIIRGLAAGADDYVTKPFGIRELLARVNNLLRRSSANKATKVEFGDVILDRDAHTLHVQQKRVTLTTKEYRLLELFVLNPYRALTRTEIMNRVWGRSVIVSGRSVDRCVATLRGKIEPDTSRPQFIHTIRDVGYRFEPNNEID